MGSNTLVTVIGGIIILVFIIIAIIIRIKTNPSTYDKEMAQNFLDKLSDVFYNKMMEIINSIDFFGYSSIEELEASVLKEIYDTIWDFVEKELEEASKKDILTALALKVINKDFVDKFIDNMIQKNGISDKLTAAWQTCHIEESNKTVTVEDAKLQEEFSSDEYNESFDNSDLPPAEEVVPTEEELANLNPPSDDETDYDPETDDSIEVMDDDTYLDTNGRKRSKSTGRFV